MGPLARHVHRPRQEPGEHAAVVADDLLLRRPRRRKHSAERTEFAYEALGPAIGVGADGSEEFTQDLSAPLRASLCRWRKAPTAINMRIG